MELNLRRVHEYTVDQTTGLTRVIAERNFISLRSGSDPALFVQAGHVFSSGGPEVSLGDLPEWFWPEYRKIIPSQRAVVGLRLPEEGEPVQPAKPAPKVQPRASEAPSEGLEDVVPGYWGCTECGDVVENKKKGVHIAKHRRAAKAKVS